MYVISYVSRLVVNRAGEQSRTHGTADTTSDTGVSMLISYDRTLIKSLATRKLPYEKTTRVNKTRAVRVAR